MKRDAGGQNRVLVVREGALGVETHGSGFEKGWWWVETHGEGLQAVTTAMSDKHVEAQMPQCRSQICYK